MTFRSNNCVAIHLKNLKKAEKFYGGVLGLKLREKDKNQLMFDAGHFLLYINKAGKKRPPIPSFDVPDVAKAKKLLKKHGCRIVKQGKGWAYFRDPFGFTFDIIEKSAP
jgi:catechol 2,3-dioxygenase-like lactoylglutathione lyase family enzyme